MKKSILILACAFFIVCLFTSATYRGDSDVKGDGPGDSFQYKSTSKIELNL